MQAADLAQHAVDAVADAQEFLLGLEVDVRGAALDGIGEQRVHQPHHRLAVLVGLAFEALVVDLAGLDLLQDPVDRELVAEHLVDGLVDLRLAGEERQDLHVHAEQGADLVERDHVEGVGHRHRGPVGRGVEGDAEDVVAPGDVLGDQLDRLGVDDHLGEIDALLAELAAQHLADDRLGGEAETHQELAQVLAGLLLLGERDGDLVAGDDPLVDQDLADQAGLAPHTHDPSRDPAASRTWIRVRTASVLKADC